MMAFFIIWVLGITITGYIVWVTEAQTEVSIGDLLLVVGMIVFLWPAALSLVAYCYWMEHLRQKVVDFLNKKIRIKGETNVRNSDATNGTSRDRESDA